MKWTALDPGICVLSSDDRDGDDPLRMRRIDDADLIEGRTQDPPPIICLNLGYVSKTPHGTKPNFWSNAHGNAFSFK